MKRLLKIGSLVSLALSVPAFAQVKVTTPLANARVSTSFSLAATAATCQSQPTASMGYSFDSGKTIIISARAINAMALTSAGPHTLHVKAWGNKGASCVAHIPLTVQDGSSVPPGVSVQNAVQQLANWKSENDSAVPGGSTGQTSLVSSPSVSGQARYFNMTFSNNGGHRFHASFAPAPNATHFIYDAKILLPSTNGIGNIELDMNQVLSNGQTVIYGFQCDGWYGVWDYTVNRGTTTNPDDTWIHTKAPCSPQQWAPNVWHHVQIAYERDSVGNVTYTSVALDGVVTELENATGNAAFSLGWGPTLLTNFQIDGRGTGSVSAYLDDVSVSYW